MAGNQLPAEVPALQPMVDAVYAFLEERHIGPTQLCALLYGLDENGRPKGPGQIYPILRGREIPKPEKVAHWKAMGGPDLAEVVGKLRELPRELVKAKPKQVPVKVTPVKAAVVAFEQANKMPRKKANPPPWPVVQPEPRPQPQEPARVGPPLFAMSVAQDGTANLTLNMVDVKLDEAIRCFQTLTLANLIKAK
jgi:hypothetical protein